MSATATHARATTATQAMTATATQAMAPIVEAAIFEASTTFATPYKLSKTYGTLASTSAVMLKLTDADGVVGWGEANPMQPFTAESVADAIEALDTRMLPIVFAQARPEPGRVDAAIDAAVSGQLCAKGAVSMALLDIAGKRLGVPAALLLGGALRDTLPVLWPLGSGTADDDAAVIDLRLAQGFRTYMLKMGSAPVADELRRVESLNARYGGKIALIADANQGWTKAEAAAFLAGARDLGLVFVEQPVAKEDLAALAELARSTPIPLSVDESLTGLAEGGEIARMGAARVFSIKSSKNGGPLRARMLSSLAAGHGIACYMNSMLEFGITQAASLQHAVGIGTLVDAGHAFMSTLRLTEDPTDFSSLVRQGTVHLPDRPGLGVSVDEDHLRRLAVSSLRRTARDTR